MTLQTIVSDGRNLSLEVSDSETSDQTALFVHGPGGNSNVWQYQQSLSPPLAVEAIDLSGHGRSDDVDAEPGWETLLAYADDLRATLKERSPTFVIGHSLGASVALTLLTSTDLNIRGLVVIGAGPRLPVNAEILRLATENFQELLAFLHAPDRLFYTLDDAATSVSKSAMESTGKAVTQRDYLTADAIDLSEDVDELAIPTLVLAGEYDRMVPPPQQRRLANSLSDGTFALVPQSAHMPMLEQPKAVNRALETFFERLSEH